MTFPETHVSLIRRIVVSGDAASWDAFVAGYWQATTRFAMRIGNLQWSDAEDAASQVFEILYQKSLLESWLSRPEARFKTLLCTVIRNVVQNTVRSQQTAARHAAMHIQRSEDLKDSATNQDLDLFYSIWADEVLRSAVKSVMIEYHREGKGDYFRVLHSRIAEQLPVKEIAGQLGIKSTDVENYFRHARSRLSDRIEQLVRKDTSFYTDFAELDEEFQHEWKVLADILQRQGGLEQAVRAAMSPKSPDPS